MKPSVPKSKELNVCGWQAVSTLFARHPGEVQRLFFDAATGKRAGEFCSLLATQKKVYRQVDAAELDKIAGSKLHGGIIAVVNERPLRKVTREVMAEWARTKAPLLLLDRGSNANNVRAIAPPAAVVSPPRRPLGVALAPPPVSPSPVPNRNSQTRTRARPNRSGCGAARSVCIGY